MSRKGKQPIDVPKGVTVTIEKDGVTVKGPKGTLSQMIPQGVQVALEGEQVTVSVIGESKKMKSFHGLYRTLICNMVEGTTKGFAKQLEMHGVGYRAQVQGSSLALQVGFSHPTDLQIPSDLSAKVDANTKITISGIDKQRVGQFAAEIRAIRPPEPYRGKGIRYAGEEIRRKAGKAAK